MNPFLFPFLSPYHIIPFYILLYPFISFYMIREKKLTFFETPFLQTIPNQFQRILIPYIESNHVLLSQFQFCIPSPQIHPPNQKPFLKIHPFHCKHKNPSYTSNLVILTNPYKSIASPPNPFSSNSHLLLPVNSKSIIQSFLFNLPSY